MDHINQVILQGYLPQDSLVRPNKRGGQYAMFTVATVERWIDKATKEEKTKTQFHRCTAWSVTPSEADFLKKGANVRVEGKIEYSIKRDEKTQTDKQYTNIIVDYIEFIQSSGDSRRREPRPDNSQPVQDNQPTPHAAVEDDLPF